MKQWDCAEAQGHFGQASADLLSPRARQSWEAHLGCCPRCREAWDRFLRLLDELEQLPAPDLPGELRERVLSQIRAHYRPSRPWYRPSSVVGLRWGWALAVLLALVLLWNGRLASPPPPWQQAAPRLEVALVPSLASGNPDTFLARHAWVAEQAAWLDQAAWITLASLGKREP